MTALFFITAILCLLYFVVIVVYSGITTGYCAIWPMLSVIFVLMGFFHRAEKRDRDGMPRRLPVFVYTTFVLGIMIVAWILFLVLSTGKSTAKEGCDYVIVMGDRVYQDGISTTLKYRLDRAAEYSVNNPDTVFVLSGGIEEDDAVPEALAMYNYLVLQGVREDRLLIETYSQSTIDRIRVSLKVIENDERVRMVPPPVMIGVITSDYNQLRAISAAKKVYPDRIYGIPIKSDGVLYIHKCLTECILLFKDYMIGNI
ncbi:MAG: YdcF family protein [Eubacteriales bacterium]|nr:YdcF family protein [Eubacteriales bacterium]